MYVWEEELLTYKGKELGLFGISHGQSIGLPNLLGVWRKEPEQVRESDTSTMQTPRDPELEAWYDRWNSVRRRD
jgi:hypothetical protein